jgi:eukaryotic-like serine/threonine-protein kinase
MNSARWQQVKHALDSVLGLQLAQRSPYLKNLSSSDPELHREVESLLRSHEKAESSFLRDPAVAVLPGFEAPRAPRTGRRISAYDILEEIGRGGMGEVYRAVRADGEFDREVAVKLVRGGLDLQFICRVRVLMRVFAF